MDEETKNNILKRMKTIMIGSLARFEENFDYLWEDDLKDRDKFFDLWQKTREEVLDYGNNQIRLAKKDLDNVSETKYRYSYRIDMRRNNNEY
jgi:hypothetical protein